MDEAIRAFLPQPSVEVQRLTTNDNRTFDARAAVVRLAAVEDRVDLVIRHAELLVRPDDVLHGQTLVVWEFAPVEVPILTRISQGLLDPDTAEIGDPFAR